MRESALLLAHRAALVVVVVREAGAAFEAIALRALDPPAAPIDVGAALVVEDALHEGARRLARQGAALAREAGVQAEALAVAQEGTVAETLIRLARHRAAVALVLGAHGHGTLRELTLGSTTREALHRAPCPVVVVGATG